MTQIRSILIIYIYRLTSGLGQVPKFFRGVQAVQLKSEINQAAEISNQACVHLRAMAHQKFDHRHLLLLTRQFQRGSTFKILSVHQIVWEDVQCKSSLAAITFPHSAA